jgi:hypothetical protein
MKKVTINLYKFEELSEEAQQKAIEKLSDINVDYEWWESTYEDAERIGLKITGFNLDRNRHATGELITSAGEVVEKILSEHGDQCETYKTALKYKDSFQNTSDEDEGIEDTEDKFLKDLLEDYSIILQNESEYLQSKEAIIETIKANDYDFTEDGKLY